MSLPIAQKIAVVLGQSMDDLFMPLDFANCRDKNSGQGEREELDVS